MKKIIIQLIREFTFPFLCAFLWTFYNWKFDLPGSKPIPVLVNIFGGTFFFVSWIVGQVFRVRKQQKIEDGLLEIERKIRDLLDELKGTAREVIGNVTGGDSFCHLGGGISEGCGAGVVFLENIGRHPLYDVNVRIFDLDKLRDRLPDDFTEIDQGVRFTAPFLLPGISYSFNVQLKPHPIHPESRAFNVFFFARNGVFNQYLRYRKVRNQWQVATKIMRDGQNVIYEKISPDYPREAGGDIDWDE